MMRYVYEYAAEIGISRETVGSIKTLLMLAAFLTVSVAFYSSYEGWTIGGSLTFVIVTMSTVGYGYSIPSDDNSRLFTIFIMIFGSFGVYGAINHVVETRLNKINRAARIREKDLDSAEIYHNHHRRLMLNICGILASLFLAAGAFALMEDLTFAKGLYFAVQTATTVGFGDVPLKNIHSRKLIGFYIIFSTVLMSCAFNNFKTLSKDFERLKEAAEFAKRKKTLAKIKELDTGNGVAMDAFLLAVLEQLGTIDRERDLEPWIKKFKEIDTDSSGFIDAVEIEAFSAQEKNLAAAQLAKLKKSGRGVSTKFSNSFSLPFNLGFADPLAGEEDDESDANSEVDRYDINDAESDDKGEQHRFGNFQFLLFGAHSRQPSASFPHHHGHTGDLMPGDLKQGSMTLSIDMDDELEYMDAAGTGPGDYDDHSHHRHPHHEHDQV